MKVLDDLRAQHREIEAALTHCEAAAAEAAQLASRLRALGPLMVKHLLAKDAFYAQLRAQCESASDLASRNVVQIFEGNMSMQSTAIRKFFEGLGGPVSPALLQSFKTMALVIRSRISAEERAVFPLFTKTAAARTP